MNRCESEKFLRWRTVYTRSPEGAGCPQPNGQGVASLGAGWSDVAAGDKIWPLWSRSCCFG
jgi:hypothetical protein